MTHPRASPSPGLREGSREWLQGLSDLRDADRLNAFEASLRAEGLAEGSAEWEDRMYAFEEMLEADPDVGGGADEER